MLVIDTEPKHIDYNLGEIINIEDKLKESLPPTEKEIQELLDYICYKTRDLLSESENETFEGKDYYAASIIYNYLKDLNIDVVPINTRKTVDFRAAQNCFLIANFVNDIYGSYGYQSYLIDPTFIQFLTAKKCDISNLKIKDGIVYRKPDVGYYINSEDKKFLFKLVENGYDYLDTVLSSIYGNAFLNTIVPINDPEITFRCGFRFYDDFTQDDKTTLLNKNQLEDMNLLIEPVKTKAKIL